MTRLVIALGVLLFTVPALAEEPAVTELADGAPIAAADSEEQAHLSRLRLKVTQRRGMLEFGLVTHGVMLGVTFLNGIPGLVAHAVGGVATPFGVAGWTARGIAMGLDRPGRTPWEVEFIDGVRGHGQGLLVYSLSWAVNAGVWALSYAYMSKLVPYVMSYSTQSGLMIDLGVSWTLLAIGLIHLARADLAERKGPRGTASRRPLPELIVGPLATAEGHKGIVLAGTF